MRKCNVMVVLSMIFKMYATIPIFDSKMRKAQVKALVRAAIIAEAKKRQNNDNSKNKIQIPSIQSLQ